MSSTPPTLPSPKRQKLDSGLASSSGATAPSLLAPGPSKQGTAVTEEAEKHEDSPEVWIKLTLSWSGKTFAIQFAESDRVMDIKDKLFDLTTVPPERQKMIGLVKGKLPADEITVRALGLVSGKKFTLIGTPVGHELKEVAEDQNSDVLNDMDIDISEYPDLIKAFQNDQRNLRKIQEATQALDIQLMNPLREGKRLLVLDLDYTLMDTKPLTSGALPPAECARPGLHQFLQDVYPYYDICIWSQTSWVWLETKLVELEMVGADKPYLISFVIDKRPMFKVFTKREGKPFSHHVKPLKVIFNKFPQWGPHNTVHIDDLARNFALNPGEGVRVSAFHEAHTENARGDRELFRLARYLVHIAQTSDDFQKVEHKDWKKVARSLRHSTSKSEPPPPASS